jgi:hypothetical protein
MRLCGLILVPSTQRHWAVESGALMMTNLRFRIIGPSRWCSRTERGGRRCRLTLADRRSGCPYGSPVIVPADISLHSYGCDRHEVRGRSDGSPHVE